MRARQILVVNLFPAAKIFHRKSGNRKGAFEQAKLCCLSFRLPVLLKRTYVSKKKAVAHLRSF